jgi:hypothetical protein
MIRRVASVAVTTLLVGSPVQAQPAANHDADQPTPVLDPEDLPVREKSYWIPAAEIVLGNLALSVGAHMAGFEWGARESEGWFDQLKTAPELDKDMYSTNQLAHPLGGAFSFSAARSSGHDFWVSSLYAIGSSTLWEFVIEDMAPSINDTITTPIGGAIIGEVVHRFGRALLYRGYGKPNLTRKAAAAILDPVGALNREWFGDAWHKTVPPNLYAHFGIGYQQPTDVLGNRSGDAQLHVEAYVEHGLLGDRAFQPRRPFDHFELYAAVNANNDNVEGDLYVRGALLGGGVWRDDIRGMYGLFGAYDFNNNDYVRASMLGFGPGATAEIPLGNRGYLAGTLAAYASPYGSAGGYQEIEGPMRDNHDGPGFAQVAELKGGKRGLFQLRGTLRAYEILGTVVGDDADEYVVQSTLGTRIQIRAHHAIGLEATHSYRRASFTDVRMNGEPDRTTDFRAFYAVTTDEILGQ